ncbi:FxsB family cyclophane-forming radical SAM/SPASM peptide maturase [Streptomyces sp. V4-01]|uniref:FxsB family cyclophane-forming radical SAM/SPASM peptide maturase n=1 Tax=Actinacidiphila polyblastidii TaxID=3110430 RepID=A0ABU7PBA4_9ACTN|nr:FxsB family cyclophane-forming radical SAM/SPASM peptide maturase [Streptomyces sp. V4-01]
MSGPLVPFRQFVLKVHSRCDLACRHCYVYEHADQSWSSRPKVISEETISWTAHRLAEHAKTHAISTVHVILHGGEPLLAGPARLRRVCEELRTRLDGVSALDLRIHTNGIQLSPRYLDVFAEFDVKVGVSLDGDKAANDRHRVYANGRSSHQRVLEGVRLLRQDRYRHLYAGLLCTVDAANDPVAVYDALAALAPPHIDFLLPHATWDEPPARPDGSATAYADWLMRVYDRWDAQGRPMPVRLFDSLLSTLAGGPSLTESLGLGPSDLVVVETDGTLEQADSLKTAYEGAPATGFDVFADSLDSAARHPGVLARQRGLAGLSEECRACPVVGSCGGGLYAHRFRAGSGGDGFGNPSVYCTDLKSLVEQVGSRTGLAPAALAPAAAVASAAPVLDRYAGVAEPAGVRELAAEQRLVTHDWLRLIDSAAGGRDPLWDRTWQWLDGAGARQDVLDAVLAHPYTRSWAAACLDEPATGGGVHRPAEARPYGRPPYDGPPYGGRAYAGSPRTAHLASLAVAAALRAGAADGLPVPVGAHGAVTLPGLGRAAFARTGPGTAEVEGGARAFVIRRGEEELEVVAGAPHDRRWQPVRALTPGPAPAGAPPALVLDDVDPWRDTHPRPAVPRLSAGEADAWRRAVGAAWALLRRTVPDRAAELSAGLAAVTPVAAGRPVRGASVLPGGRRGLGAVGVVYAAEAPVLARRLLSAWQCAKLDALLERFELYDEAAPHSFPQPWGGPPLPVGELFARACARSATAALAADPAAHVRATGRALDDLCGTGVLTALGDRFAQGLRAALESVATGR